MSARESLSLITSFKTCFVLQMNLLSERNNIKECLCCWWFLVDMYVVTILFFSRYEAKFAACYRLNVAKS
jgi:hypothetical protein